MTDLENTEVEATPPAPKESPPPAPPAQMKSGFIWGTGRRKSSVARVRLKPGSGKIEINCKDYPVFFPTEVARLQVIGPMRATDTLEKYDVFVKVSGGGITGQAGATALGIGRALKEIDPSLELTLREGGFLTRDSRMKERKKYGLRGRSGSIRMGHSDRRRSSRGRDRRRSWDPLESRKPG